MMLDPGNQAPLLACLFALSLQYQGHLEMCLLEGDFFRMEADQALYDSGFLLLASWVA